MSTLRIKGASGVVIDSQYWLELPKAPTKKTAYSERAGMIRYNNEWKSFEGVLQFTDGSLAYRRFANLDENGLLLTSQLPDSVTSGMEYMGTYSPIMDDVDPPLSGVTPLPVPTAANSGEYLIIRGLYDAAQTHFTTNNPTTATVIFTPVNPSGAGNWVEIKYYVGTNPVDVTKKIVIAAFGRLIKSAIPATGHAGLLALSADADLTAAFTSTVNMVSEKALADSDMIISDGLKIQRQRQNRVSMIAGSVIYDRSVITSAGRAFSSSSGSVQSTLDSIGMDTLRRTGDTMYDNGGIGKGRLGVVMGTASAPAIAFNSTSYSPTSSGLDPSKWSDTNTGIFSPVKGTISLSSSGAEKLRVANGVITIIQSGTFNAATNPSLQFQGTGNTNNLGITAINNKFSFSIVNTPQVELLDGQSNFFGSVNIQNNLLVQGNSIVNGNSDVLLNFTVGKNTTLGTAKTDYLNVNATTNFKANVSFGSNGNPSAMGSVSYGSFQFVGNTSHTNGSTETYGSGSSVTFNNGGNDDVRMVYAPTTNVFTFTQTGTKGEYDFVLGSNVAGTENIRLTRDGIKLPDLQPIDDAVGVDGMIAYSPDRKSVMQKSNGTWSNIGSGSVIVTEFTTSNWVLSGSFYTYTITNPDIRSVAVQEKVGNNYNQVEVDTVTISTTNAVISIPAGTPDLRFNGRVLVTYSK